ncbi:uncharacterized protein AruCF_1319 [Achromobacter ruhlandii]|nr:uncharacterized protein AruCF_1319 [Achromobacter ruhlandii]
MAVGPRGAIAPGLKPGTQGAGRGGSLAPDVRRPSQPAGARRPDAPIAAGTPRFSTRRALILDLSRFFVLESTSSHEVSRAGLLCFVVQHSDPQAHFCGWQAAGISTGRDPRG